MWLPVPALRGRPKVIYITTQMNTDFNAHKLHDHDYGVHISHADHNTLLQSNRTYQVCVQRIEHLNMERQELLIYK